MRYLIDFSYNGSRFNGYQKQNNKRTVQKEIENVLTNINEKEVIIYASGRTDAHVNALHQKAHFDLSKNITAYKLKGALNSYLPSDIYINDVKCVSDDFHARYMVKSKTYEYLINIGTYNPLQKDYIYQYCKKLNIDKMKKAINYFIGTHDFTTFTSSEDKREDKVRSIFSAEINYDIMNNIIAITFCGKGFLKYQIRNMVGTLIKIGEEEIPYDIIPELINAKDRKKAYLCAPAEGLTLKNVEY